MDISDRQQQIGALREELETLDRELLGYARAIELVNEDAFKKAFIFDVSDRHHLRVDAEISDENRDYERAVALHALESEQSNAFEKRYELEQKLLGLLTAAYDSGESALSGFSIEERVV